MKVLVTGVTGFLGHWMYKRLVQEGHEVYGLLRKDPGLDEDFSGLFRLGDVTDGERLKASFRGMDAIFHLAGVIGYHPSMRPLMDQVNVQGTANVIAACQANRIENLMYFSSVTAIGAGFNPGQILNETSEYNLASLNFGYFETKRAAEALVLEAHNKGIINAFIVNPSTTYGPGDAMKGSRKSQVKVAQGRLKIYPSGGSSVVGVEDLIDGVMKVWKKGRSGERYILAGDNLLIQEIFSIIADTAGVSRPNIQIPTPIFLGLGRIVDLMRPIGFKGSFGYENAKVATLFHFFDSAKARKELGYNPAPAKHAIIASVNWMKENGLVFK